MNREAEEEGGGGERNAAGIGWQTRRQINDRKKSEKLLSPNPVSSHENAGPNPPEEKSGQVICALQALEKEIISSLCAHLMPDLALSGADTEES